MRESVTRQTDVRVLTRLLERYKSINGYSHTIGTAGLPLDSREKVARSLDAQSPGLDAFTSFYVILYAILYAILYVRFTQGLDASTQGLDASTLPWSDSMLRQRKG